MTGTVRQILPQRTCFFVRGDDGETYWCADSERAGGMIEIGARVQFLTLRGRAGANPKAGRIERIA